MDNLWQADILGNGFEKKYITMPDDYSGHVRCTVVRLLCPGAKRAAVYVHGFSDYFFQADMAREFVAHGYSFYAIDLRKYGRSLMPGQKAFQVRDMAEYFPDIQDTIDTAKADGASEIVLIGHSTGGLTCSLFMMRRPDKAVKALILNSPFLSWNLPKVMTHYVMPVVKKIARVWPSLKLKSGGTIDYNRAISNRLEGEWDYNSDWKPDIMPDVDAGWIRAIDNGQKSLAGGQINVPVLLMHSDKSAWSGDGREAFTKSDGVLDVDKIAAVGRRLGPDVTEVTVKDGLHDLVLSRLSVRTAVYSTIFAWLGKVLK